MIPYPGSPAHEFELFSSYLDQDRLMRDSFHLRRGHLFAVVTRCLRLIIRVFGLATGSTLHFGNLLRAYQEGIQREPLIPGGPPLDDVPRAAGGPW